MSVLLDTGAFLWATAFPERLSEPARDAITSPASVAFLSVASMWEIAIKVAAGKLHLPAPPRDYVPSRVRRLGLSVLDIAPEHAFAVVDLPAIHRDPFDRILVAQATAEGLALVTSDAKLARYGVEIIPAAARG